MESKWGAEGKKRNEGRVKNAENNKQQVPVMSRDLERNLSWQEAPRKLEKKRLWSEQRI